MSRIAVTAISPVPSSCVCSRLRDGYLLGMAIKQKLARKAVKSTAKHTAHGATAKLKRQPVRTATLLGIGCVTGGIAGWALARSNSSAPVGGAA